jgi:hypothetical protein
MAITATGAVTETAGASAAIGIMTTTAMERSVSLILMTIHTPQNASNGLHFVSRTCITTYRSFGYN